MRINTINRLAAAGTIGIASFALAESVRFEVIASATEPGKSSEANDLSPDGRWIVGTWDVNADGFADENYRLDTETNTLMILGGTGRAVAISDDGQTVLGNMIDPGGSGANVAAIWTQAGGWQSLGYLPNAQPCPSLSTGYELSADGTVATGLSWDGCNGQGFKWTQAGGMEGLEILANGTNRASVLSADGSIIAGFAQGSQNRTPAIWNGGSLEGELLDPPDGDVIGEVQGISDDGQTLLVEWNGDAVTWTGAGLDVIDEGQLIPGWTGEPFDIADDGTIVGFDFLGGSRRAWIALPAGSEEVMIDLETFVTSQGGVLPAGFLLQVCQAISIDGRTVVGHSGFPTPGAWILHRCPEDVDGNGSVDVTDLLDVLGQWGTCTDCTTPFACPADINGDCQLDVTDLLAVLGRWGPC